MAGRSRGRNSNNRFYHVNARNEHDDRSSRPSTSRGGGGGGGSGGGYSDHGFNKKVTFKANNRGGKNFLRKSWDNKTDLVRDQLDNEYSSNRYQSRNNPGRRNHGRGGDNNFRNQSWTLKESPTGWYSVIVPNVEDGDEVLKIIQTYISPIQFYPYNKQYLDNSLRFVLDDFKTAKTLHNISYNITLRDDRKLIIKVISYMPPRGVISFTPVSSEVKIKMIEAMALRFNPNTKSLDLSRFYACPLFTENQMFVPLNRPAVLLAALNIIAQHTKHDLYGLSLANNQIYLGEGLIWIRRLFPELKVLDLSDNKLADFKELKSLSGYTIEVLNLSKNPLCDIENKERYNQDVRKIFPMLNKLDDSDLPSQYSAINKTKFKMPVNFGNSFPIPEGHNPEQPNPIASLVESFLTQYYERYDNKLSRQMVSEAYHENATFSLSSCFLSNLSKGSLSHYLPEARNFLKSDRNKNGRHRNVLKGKDNVINFIDKLPKSKHDLGSFLVDVPLANAAMIQINVNGVFAEDFKETNLRPVFRSFFRTFCIVPVGSGWSIMNDMLFITIVSDELLIESSKRFSIYKPKTISSKKSNFNGNGNNNATMIMEDTDEMIGMEASALCQQPVVSNFQPPPYQGMSFPSYQPSLISAPVNQQQPPPPYPTNLQTQNQQTTFQQQQQNISAPLAIPFQSNPQQVNSSFSMYNATSTEFPSNSLTSVSTPVNQQLTKVSINPNNNTNANPDKLTMVKNFSNESGMNNEWAEKCLQENDWNYSKAALCFSKLKANIPPVAFIQ